MTNEVWYLNGIAVKVVNFWSCNGCPASSVYLACADGIHEWHEDPENGNWEKFERMDDKRLADLRKHNPHCIPIDDLLGKSPDAVRKSYKEKKIELSEMFPDFN